MHPTRPRLVRPLAGLAAVAALVALAGCAGAGSDSADSTAAGTSDNAALKAEGPADSPAPEAAFDAVGDEAGGSTGSRAQSDDDGPDTAIIATGAVALEAEDVAGARLEVRKIVDLQQGAVVEQETSAGDDGEVEAARLVVRVPSGRFDAATAALEKVGTLTDSTSSEEDVTAKVVDVAARVRAQRKSVARIEALLARAQDLKEVVAIEGQLADRQAELDALVARQRSLADRTSMSTITVSLQQPDSDEEKDDDSPAGFLGGLRDGWDAFVGGVVVTLTVLGFALPWLILVAALGTPVWLLLRRRSARRPAPPLATP